MPVRIYDIAKKLGLENKEILTKAKELGIAAAKVASSSLDKISAEWLEEEIIKASPALTARFAPKPAEEAPKPTPVEEKIVVIHAPTPPPAPEPLVVAAPVAEPQVETVTSAPVAEVISTPTHAPVVVEAPKPAAPPAPLAPVEISTIETPTRAGDSACATRG